jgi:predicted DCC family thiol-disulfide oxidoreductase YuxK
MVEWIATEARENAFETIPCQAPALKKRFPLIDQTACMKAVHLVLPNGTVTSGGQAIPELLSRLKRFSSLAALFKLPGARVMARAFYRWVADRRYQAPRLLIRNQRRSG